MLQRIITGVLLAPVVLAAFWFSPERVGLVLAFLAALVAYDEFLRLSKDPGKRLSAHWLGSQAALLLLLSAAVFLPRYTLLAMLGGAMFILFLRMLRAGDLSDLPQKTFTAIAGLVWVGLPFSILLGLLWLAPDLGRRFCLTLFAVVWVGDTAAYFGGKALGRHKLHPAISPKKTVEGGVAGLLGSVGAALAVHYAWGMPGLGLVPMMLLGLAGGAAEQIGDFCESMLKRAVGAKDSGNLLPGHGGMFDRIDGLLFAVPVIYAVFLVFVK